VRFDNRWNVVQSEEGRAHTVPVTFCFLFMTRMEQAVQAYEQCQVCSPTTDPAHDRLDRTQVVMIAAQLVLESMASLTKQYATAPCCSWRFCCWASSCFVCLAGASTVYQTGSLLLLISVGVLLWW
jgi:hypothetical protein